MQKLRILGLASVAVLALTAMFGVASASAGTKFSAEKYPAVYKTEKSSQYFNFNGWSGACSSRFSAELPAGPTENLSVVPETECSSSGIKSTMKMNGCRFEFHPGYETYSDNGEFEGTFDVGPAGCGPINLKLYTCEISIGAQTGLNAHFKNIGTGTSRAIEFGPDTSKIKYLMSGSCSGTYENGSYSSTWTAIGSNPTTGQQYGSYLQGELHPPMFEADGYPAEFSGHQSSTAKQVFTVEKGALNASCNALTPTGNLSGPNAIARIVPTFAECKAFGLNATIKMNGCDFKYQAVSWEGGSKYTGLNELSCPSGKALEIATATCGVTVPGQALGIGTYTNTIDSGLDSVLLSTNASGLSYTVVKDGIGCPLSGTGARTDGTYAGGTVLQAGESDLRIGL